MSKPEFEEYLNDTGEVTPLVVWLQRLEDEAQPVSYSSVNLLSALASQNLDALKESWPRISQERKRALIGHAADAASENLELDLRRFLLFALSDADDQVRQKAVEGLDGETDPDSVSALLATLEHDPSSEVRATAASGLAAAVAESATGELEGDFDDRLRDALFNSATDEGEAVAVRRRALESLAALDDEETNELIEEAADDADREMRVSAIFAMGRSANPQWTTRILRELENEDAEFRFEAARATGEVLEHDDVAVRQLIRLAEEDLDSEVQQAAILSLGLIGGAEAARFLRHVREGGSPALRQAAIEALKELDFENDALGMPLGDALSFFAVGSQAGSDQDEDGDDDELLDDDDDAPEDEN